MKMIRVVRKKDKDRLVDRDNKDAWEKKRFGNSDFENFEGCEVFEFRCAAASENG